MRVLVRTALLTCSHGGIVVIEPQQEWLCIEGSAVLIEDDTLNRPILACPMVMPGNPCTQTVSVSEAATYAHFIRIRTRNDATARRICLDTATGHTDWNRTSTVSFSVKVPGQTLVVVRA